MASFLLLLGLLLLMCVYCGPLFVAVARKHRKAGVIALIGICLGWTVVGWFVAFGLALNDDVEQQATGGSSGV